VVLKSQEEDGRSFTKRLDEIISLMKVAGASVTRLYVELDPVKSVHACVQPPPRRTMADGSPSPSDRLAD
jgi:hypothetical protein